MPTRNRLSNSLFLFLLFGIFMEISLTLFLSLSRSLLMSGFVWLYSTNARVALKSFVILIM